MRRLVTAVFISVQIYFWTLPSYSAGPNGTFANSCTLCGVVGTVIQCQCLRVNKTTKDTSMDFARCIGQTLENLDGQLSCTRGDLNTLRTDSESTNEINSVQLKQLCVNGKGNLAIDACSKIINKDNNDAEAWFHRGVLKVTNDGITDMMRGARLNPENALYIYAASHSMLSVDMYDEDDDFLNSLIAQSASSRREIAIQFAEVEGHRNHYGKELAYINEAIRYDPNEATNWGAKCYTELKLRQAANALKDCDKAISLRRYREALLYKAIALSQLKQYVEAIAVLDAMGDDFMKFADGYVFVRGKIKNQIDAGSGNDDIILAAKLKHNIDESFKQSMKRLQSYYPLDCKSRNSYCVRRMIEFSSVAADDDFSELSELLR